MAEKVERGSFSTGSIGTSTILLQDATMVPREITFFTGSHGTSDTVNHTCDGFMNGDRQQARGTFTDSTGSKTSIVNNKCITHYSRVSGTITEIITATKPASPFATAGQFDVTFSAANATPTIFFIARGS